MGKTRMLSLASVAIMAAGCGVANTNQIAVGVARTERRLPSAYDLMLDGFVIHFDPTVMLWARDAELDLPRLMSRALTTIEDDVHGPPVAISVSAGSYRVIPDIGIGGSTDPYTGNVRISMDARSREPLRTLLSIWLPLTLAHELHHSKRILDGPGYGSTLLESMVSEGSAMAFARQQYPDAPIVPWLVPMTSEDELTTWRKARTQLDATDDIDLHHAWFFGGRGVPRFSGYKVGYAIVTSYLKRHPEATPAGLALLPAADVLRESRYGP